MCVSLVCSHIMMVTMCIVYCWFPGCLGRSRDFYHTCYCLSGLSVCQHFPSGASLGNNATLNDDDDDDENTVTLVIYFSSS